MKTKTTAVTDDQKRVLRVKRANPEKTPKEVAESIPDSAITPQYADRIINDFKLPDEPGPMDIIPKATQKSGTDDEPEAEDSTDEADDEFTPAERARKFETLGEKTQEVIETIRENPDIRRDELAETVAGSQNTIRNAVRFYPHLFPDDAAIYEDVVDSRERDVDDLREGKRKEVIKYLRENPTATCEEMLDKLDVGYSMVLQGVQEYTHLIPEEAADNFEVLKRNADVNCHSKGGRTGATSGPKTRSENLHDRIDRLEDDGSLDSTDAERLRELLDRGDIDDAEDALKADDTTDELGDIFDDDGYLKTTARGEDDEADEDEPRNPFDALEQKVFQSDDGRPGIDAGYQSITERPSLRGQTTDEVETEADEPLDIDEAIEEGIVKTNGHVVIDAEAIDRLEEEIEFHENTETSGALTDYTAGLKRALDIVRKT